MKFTYRLARVCGSVHDRANLVFARSPQAGAGSEDEVLFSAVGNRVAVFELTKHTTYVLPVECRRDIRRLAVSHSGALLIAVDDEGYAAVISVLRRIVLHRFNFKGLVRVLAFSPDDRWLAVARGRKLQIWKAPGHRRELAPFTLHNTLAGHHDEVTTLSWSADGRYIMTGARDNTVRIWSTHPTEGYEPFQLAGHKDRIVGSFFADDNSAAYTLARDGGLFVWDWITDSVADAAASSLFFLDRGEGSRGSGSMTIGGQGHQGATLHVAKGQWKVAGKHFLWADQPAMQGGAQGNDERRLQVTSRSRHASISPSLSLLPSPSRSLSRSTSFICIRACDDRVGLTSAVGTALVLLKRCAAQSFTPTPIS